MPQPPVKRGGLIISRSSFREMCRHRYSHATTEIDIAARQNPPRPEILLQENIKYIIATLLFTDASLLLWPICWDRQTDRRTDGRTDGQMRAVPIIEIFKYKHLNQ